jgi:hypothetical protein
MDWLEELAATLAVEAPTAQETAELLDAARDVAHQVERKITPLSTFVLGMAVERRVAGGASRDEALLAVLAGLRASLPGRPEDRSDDPR